MKTHVQANVELPGRWKHRLDVGDIFDEFEDAEEGKIPAGDAIRVSFVMIGRLSALAKAGGPTYPDTNEFRDVLTASALNEAMVRFYDWADTERVWTGG